MIRTIEMHNNSTSKILLIFYKGERPHIITLAPTCQIKYTFSDKDASLSWGDIDIPLDVNILMIGFNKDVAVNTVTVENGIAHLNYHPFKVTPSLGSVEANGNNECNTEVSFSKWIDVPNSLVRLRDVCRDYVLEYANLLGLSPLRASILSDKYGSHVIRHDIFLHYTDKRYAYNWLMEQLDMPDRCVEITDHKVSIQEGESSSDNLGRGLRHPRNHWG